MRFHIFFIQELSNVFPTHVYSDELEDPGIKAKGLHLSVLTVASGLQWKNQVILQIDSVVKCRHFNHDPPNGHMLALGTSILCLIRRYVIFLYKKGGHIIYSQNGDTFKGERGTINNFTRSTAIN